jgi:phospholipid/cholesterol/gamma-HCH transport system ATP-binding protein
MADQQRSDPPWGRPLEESDEDREQRAAEEDSPRASEQSAQDPDEPDAARAEQAYHDEPGGPGGPGGLVLPGVGDRDEQEAEEEAGGDGEGRHTQTHVGNEYDPNESDFPGNVLEATREGEHPYQWHKGQRPADWENAVEFIDLKKSFGRSTILNGLNLALPDNQISMILGPSGTGKSVTIKHMIGLLYPDEGDVLVHGESVPNMTDDELFAMRKKFGVLFQDGALFGSMNVFDNVAFPLRQHTEKGEDEVQELVMGRLREVGLGGAGDKFPNELSGGMRKRAGFARALVLEPSIVIFDEPDSGLDPVRTALLGELIQEIHASMGGAFIIITHDILSARRVADYIAVVWKGRIVEAGPAHEMINSDNQFIRQFLAGESQGPLGMD